MSLTENQELVEGAIYKLCTPSEPFATIEDITDEVPFTKQTVLNNVDAVVEANNEIATRTVGQANVYYVSVDRLEEIWSDQTETVGRLLGPGSALFYELRCAPEESDFDLEAVWYDGNADVIEGYVPEVYETGEALGGYGSEPVAIKMYDREALDADFETLSRAEYEQG